MFEELKNDLVGLRVLKDWLGEGGVPVEKGVAESRAMVCVHGNEGASCPMNVSPKWWERAKSAIAARIRKQIELKNSANLKVGVENDLGICKPCGCAIPLKIHVPIEHIAKHLTEETKVKLVPYCWILKELK